VHSRRFRALHNRANLAGRTFQICAILVAGGTGRERRFAFGFCIRREKFNVVPRVLTFFPTGDNDLGLTPGLPALTTILEDLVPW
jgi:hypothetical protein